MIFIHYSSPPARPVFAKSLVYDTPEKRKQRREKLKTSDTLEDWDTQNYNAQQLDTTSKPDRSHIKFSYSTVEDSTRLKVTFTYKGFQENQLEL